MTECQGCGAWNDITRSVCVLCGTLLAETDEWDAGQELPPLPALPDGGLSASMPAWLRALPQLAQEETAAPAPPTLAPSAIAPPALALEATEPLGPRADPRTFLTDDDFPRWLRDLAAREARGLAAVSERAVLVAELPRPAEWPDWPGPPTSANPNDGQDGPAPALPDGLPPAAVVVARALEERRARAPWETLLLIILFIGVIVAALWALVSNGVFSPSL